MSKGAYIPWTASEENNLERWLSEHRWMSWERRAEEYSKQHNKGRSFESLRGKYNQLRKGIRRRRPISDRMSTRTRTAARRTRYRRQRLPEGFPPCPPVLRLKRPDPWARRILQQGQTSESSRPQAFVVASQYQNDHESLYPAYHAPPGR
jgi:hypothetical protein